MGDQKNEGGSDRADRCGVGDNAAVSQNHGVDLAQIKVFVFVRQKPEYLKQVVLEETDHCASIVHEGRILAAGMFALDFDRRVIECELVQHQ